MVFFFGGLIVVVNVLLVILFDYVVVCYVVGVISEVVCWVIDFGVVLDSVLVLGEWIVEWGMVVFD